MSNESIAIAIATAQIVRLVMIRTEARSGLMPAMTAATSANCVPINIGPRAASP